jgi:hypothetical protein
MVLAPACPAPQPSAPSARDHAAAVRTKLEVTAREHHARTEEGRTERLEPAGPEQRDQRFHPPMLGHPRQGRNAGPGSTAGVHAPTRYNGSQGQGD